MFKFEGENIGFPLIFFLPDNGQYKKSTHWQSPVKNIFLAGMQETIKPESCSNPFLLYLKYNLWLVCNQPIWDKTMGQATLMRSLSSSSGPVSTRCIETVRLPCQVQSHCNIRRNPIMPEVKMVNKNLIYMFFSYCSGQQITKLPLCFNGKHIEVTMYVWQGCNYWLHARHFNNGSEFRKNSNNKMVSTNITYSVTILAIAYLVHWGIFIFV